MEKDSPSFRSLFRSLFLSLPLSRPYQCQPETLAPSLPKSLTSHRGSLSSQRAIAIRGGSWPVGTLFVAITAGASTGALLARARGCFALSSGRNEIFVFFSSSTSSQSSPPPNLHLLLSPYLPSSSKTMFALSARPTHAARPVAATCAVSSRRVVAAAPLRASVAAKADPKTPLEAAIDEAKDTCESGSTGECAVAWDTVS